MSQLMTVIAVSQFCSVVASIAQLRDELEPELICDYGQYEQNAYDHGLQIAVDARQVHAVLHETDEDRSQDAAAQPAHPAPQAHPADDAGGDRFERHGGADVGLAGFEPR